VQWSTSSGFIYLNSKQPQQHHNSNNQYAYFKHYISQVDKGISLYLTALNGSPQLFVSLDPKNQKPNSDNYNVIAYSQQDQGRSMTISSDFLKSKNPACDDLGLAEEDSCVVYMGVYC